jgi:hypothetical protein
VTCCGGKTKSSLGLYKAAEAFFEGLNGPIAKRSNHLDRQYIFQCDDSKTHEGHEPAKASELIDLVSTSVARAWLQNYDPSGLFPLAVAGREWWNQWTVSTRQQMIHIPKEAILRWKSLAAEAGATVSRFDLVASWLHVVRVPDRTFSQAHPFALKSRSIADCKTVSRRSCRRSRPYNYSEIHYNHEHEEILPRLPTVRH